MTRTCHNCKFYRDGVTDAERRAWSWSNTGKWARGMCYRNFDYDPGPRPVIPRQSFPGCGKGWEAKDMEQITFREVDT